MQVWTFASGSSGNCFFVESEGTRLLVECGRTIESIKAYLETCEASPRELSGILLTHAHGDHARSARYLSYRYKVPVFASIGTLGCLSLRDQRLGRPIESDKPFTVGEIDVIPFAVPHDCFEPLAYRFESASGRACITTDLGWVPDSAIQRFTDLDLLVLEANYDPYLLYNGTYPSFLKRRVGGRQGHLSNAAAGQAIAACGDHVAPTVWLAHISEENNTPRQALATVGGILRRRGLAHVRLQTTRHRRPSLYWSTATAPERQLRLF
jgi:phosphoribosyl 1,2-cyclic phosphodiesterase